LIDGTYRGRWVDEVFRTPHVSAEVKVFLLFLAHYYMDSEGRVSERREDLAERVGCDPRNVTAKFSSAIAAGLMKQTVRGQKHRNAAYQAVVPGTSQGDGSHHPEDLAQGDDGHHPENAQGDGNHHPETSQGDGFYHPEKSAQGDDNHPPETPQGDDIRHPETPPLYKDRARALITADRSDPTADVTDHGDEAVVIDLFGKEDPSLRSEKTPARKRASQPSIEERLFEDFWRAYPRRIAKAAAKKSWVKALKAKADPEQIIAAARQYATEPRRVEADIKYTPHPATWLNNERWADEPDPAPSPERVAANGYQPYQNPTNQDEYDEDM
jgi:hypothetical protein